MAAIEMAAIAKAAMTSIEKVKTAQKAAELSLMKKMKDLPENVTRSVKKSVEEVAKHPVETVSKIAVSAVFSHEAKDDPDIQDLKGIYNAFTAPKDLVTLSKSIAEEVGLGIASEDPDLQDIAKVTSVGKTAYQVYKKIQNLPEHVEQKDSEKTTGEFCGAEVAKKDTSPVIVVEQSEVNGEKTTELLENIESFESTTLQHDTINLKEISHNLEQKEYVDFIRIKNDKVNEVIERWGNVLKDSQASPMEKTGAQNILSRYKGNVMEALVKDEMEDYFENIGEQQRIVKTELGGTKPDIELHNAQTEFSIDGLDIKAGDDLGIELKCGKASYLFGQMEHINKQVKGLGENRLVMVTKDYYDMTAEQKNKFMKMLKENGAGLYVLDVHASSIMSSIQESIWKGVFAE